MKISRHLLAAVFALAAVGSQAANLVSNGSFEANSIANGSWRTYSTLTGWTGTPNVELRNNVAGAAQDGFNYVELDTSRNSGITQTVFGTGLVDLSFWYSARPQTGTTTNDLNVSFGDFNASFLHGIGNSTNHNIWQQFTQRIDLGYLGSATLAFSAAGASDGYGGSLDNITVTAVPEPGTYVMFLTGLGMMAAVGRRRSRAGKA